MIQPMWKTLPQFLKKLNIKLARDPAIPPLVYTRIESRDSNIQLYISIHSIVIHNSQKVENPNNLLTGAWINKMWLSTYSGILFGLKSDILTHTMTRINLMT